MNNKTTLAITVLMAGALLTTIATTFPSADAEDTNVDVSVDVQTDGELIGNDQGDNSNNNQQFVSNYQCGLGEEVGQCASNNVAGEVD